ncbi:hypothetical protein V8G54_035670 [Vigna mungo]|uniref:Uncharacterized protein n=1 Tax=Vigna mungo TaxID=3915 RepID=A0AAQ3MFW0_VIGMU
MHIQQLHSSSFHMVQLLERRTPCLIQLNSRKISTLQQRFYTSINLHACKANERACSPYATLKATLEKVGAAAHIFHMHTHKTYTIKQPMHTAASYKERKFHMVQHPAREEASSNTPKLSSKHVPAHNCKHGCTWQQRNQPFCTHHFSNQLFD